MKRTLAVFAALVVLLGGVGPAAGSAGTDEYAPILCRLLPFLCPPRSS